MEEKLMIYASEVADEILFEQAAQKRIGEECCKAWAGIKKCLEEWRETSKKFFFRLAIRLVILVGDRIYEKNCNE